MAAPIAQEYTTRTNALHFHSAGRSASRANRSIDKLTCWEKIEAPASPAPLCTQIAWYWYLSSVNCAVKAHQETRYSAAGTDQYNVFSMVGCEIIAVSTCIACTTSWRYLRKHGDTICWSRMNFLCGRKIDTNLARRLKNVVSRIRMLDAVTSGCMDFLY